MEDQLPVFLRRVPNNVSRSSGEFIDFLVYFLTIELGRPAVTPVDIEDCYRVGCLAPYSNIRQYLSSKAARQRGKKAKFLRLNEGYVLERSRMEEINQQVGIEPSRREISKSLRDLLPLLPGENERAFLREAIDCYEVGAYRAAIVMGWLLTIDHLYDYVIQNTLPAFNAELANVTDRRVKVRAVNSKDDFGDIPENRFIELLRASKVISNDVRKILDEKLGTRNSAAHPSTITIHASKATEFLQDLITNVVVKYPI